MATGFQLKSAWGFQQRTIKPFCNMGSSVMFRQEIDHPYCRPWMWDNFYFGTDYSGTTRSISVSDLLVDDLPVGQVFVDAVSGNPAIYLGNPLIFNL